MPTRQQPTLTRREQEVAALVAEGLTNRQIAERLFISERTAEHHAEQIRSKLGFHSRAQIAAWVVGSGTPAATPVPASLASVPVEPSLVEQPSSAHPRGRHLAAIAVAVVLLAAAGLAALAFSASRGAGPAITIVTVAGTGRSSFSQDGRSATATDLIHPSALAVDPNGALYFIDGNRVRMITAHGTINTIAGTGESGDAGDGGDALSAQLNAPRALAIDPDGDVFIVDTGNNRVREVDTTGKIFTVAGAGDAGYSGDGGLAIRARLNSPTGLAIGFGGSLFIADTLNNRVREVAANGVIHTVAGTGSAAYTFEGVPATAAPLSSPGALTFDSEGNLFVADVGNGRVRKVDLSGDITTVAGTGTNGFSGDGQRAYAAELKLATEEFQGGQSLAVDSEGNLYIADTGNDRIRKVDLGGNISSLAGPESLSLPRGLAVDGHGILYVADSANNRIREIAIH